jgi:molybdopterin biosynthesis enzyme
LATPRLRIGRRIRIAGIGRRRDACGVIAEVLAIGEADGRIAAEDVTALTDVPPFDRAAMDGYAVRSDDTTGAVPDAPRRLICTGQVLAGQVISRSVGPGECIEIATGAPVPAGADAVVMVEQTLRDGAGGQWDPQVVDSFLKCKQKVQAIRQRGIVESLRQAIDGALRNEGSTNII